MKAMREAIALQLRAELKASAVEMEVTDASRFEEDLGLDSLDRLEILMKIEDRFDIEISDEDGNKLKTFGEAVNYLAGRDDLRL